jgi:hypothetical protein
MRLRGRERPTLVTSRLPRLASYRTNRDTHAHTHTIYESPQTRCRLTASSRRCYAHCKSIPTKKTRHGMLYRHHNTAQLTQSSQHPRNRILAPHHPRKPPQPLPPNLTPPHCPRALGPPRWRPHQPAPALRVPHSRHNRANAPQRCPTRQGCPTAPGANASGRRPESR